MSLEIRLVQDKTEAEKLWKSLTPNETIYDDWDFRNTFHSYQKQELFFVAGYDGSELTNLLALQYNADRKCLEFFGSNYMEDNRVLTKAGFEHAIPAMYDYLKTLGKPVILECIRGNDPFTASLPVQDNKFVLPLTFTSTDEYIAQTFQGETKKKLIKRLRKIEDLGLTVTENNFSDIPQFLSWNVAAYGGEEAFLDRPFRKEIFTDYLIKEHANFKPSLLTFSIGEDKQAVTMNLVYKNHTYCYVNSGLKPELSANMREYIHLKKVEKALAHGCKEIDAFTGDYGWKERWGFNTIPQHSYQITL